MAPRQTTRSTPKLVAFDVDGTLLRGATICECIAAGLDRREEMAAFERLVSIEDIAQARKVMATWYRPHATTALLEYMRSATLAPGARAGVEILKAAGVKVALVSITWQFAVEWLAAELGADFAVGTHLRQDGQIDHFWPEDKTRWLRTLLADLGLDPPTLAAVGDSPGDLPMLRLAGVGYYVGQNAPALPPHVKHWPAADIGAIAAELVAGIDELGA